MRSHQRLSEQGQIKSRVALIRVPNPHSADFLGARVALCGSYWGDDKMMVGIKLLELDLEHGIGLRIAARRH